MIRASGSLACAAALAVYPAVFAGRLGWLHAAVGVAAVALLAAGLALRRSGLLVWALLLLGADFALWLALGTSQLDQRAPIVGAGLVLAAELAYDSLEPEVGPLGSTAALARLITLVLVTLAAVGTGVLVVALAAVPLGGGVVVTALGAAAAVLALAVIARLAAGR